jgi:hypothetical protein
MSNTMWPDRRSSVSTPSGTPPPHGRPYSPAGASRRGPYTLSGTGPLPPRPGMNPRNSSVSLLPTPNTSTSSLPATARLPNGSALRNEIRKSPGPDVPNPLHVLQNIIGAPPRRTRLNGGSSTEIIRPEEMVEDVNFEGLSLQAFADGQGQKPVPVGDVRSYSAQSIEECMFILQSTFYRYQLISIRS